MAIFLCHSLEEHSKAPFLHAQSYVPYYCCSFFDGSFDSSTPQLPGSLSSFGGDRRSLLPLPSTHEKIIVGLASACRSGEGGCSQNNTLNIPLSRTTSATIPKRRRCFSVGSMVNAPRSPAFPDRFIPGRESFDTSASPLRLNRSPHHLSPEEKLLRRRDTGADPFKPCHPRRAVSILRQDDQGVRRRSPHFVPHLVDDLAILRDDDSAGVDDQRQVSVGAVWNVGGSSAATGDSLGVLDGMGSLLARGSIAPTYVVNFHRKITATEERKIHESRLALALDIDLAHRLLDICKVPAQLRTMPNPASPLFERCSPLTWRDNAWRRVESIERKYGI
jgi:hypothetical protein